MISLCEFSSNINPNWPMIVVFSNFLSCIEEGQHLMHFQGENAVLRSLQHSADEASVIRFLLVILTFPLEFCWGILPFACCLKCFLSELGSVYLLGQPGTWQAYGFYKQNKTNKIAVFLSHCNKHENRNSKFDRVLNAITSSHRLFKLFYWKGKGYMYFNVAN